MKFYSLLLCLPLCWACGANPSSAPDTAVQDAEPQSGAEQALPGKQLLGEDKVAELPDVFEGRVKGFDFHVVETVFVAGDVEIGTTVPVLVVVQSDVANTCAHLQNGTYPKDGTFFPMALIQSDGAAVAANRLYKPSNPDDETTDSYWVFAQLRHFNATCAIEPDAADGMAILGSAIVDDYSPGHSAQGRFAFEMGQDHAPVSGSFNATYCQAPNLLKNANALMDPQIDSDHCL